ncbi:MAG TPA: peptide-methionine (S)-S-oxide reductase MsrA [Thermoanaerobaculia bacterium]|nr:peptide-methionine (S)-S-oxide reductase MsrA [Thermoanaerobaculia bacterium]
MKLALTVVSIACVLALLALGLRAQNRAGADPLAQKAQNAQPAGAKLAKATFAGGCFWCMEPPYDKLPGVVSTTSGYTGGQVKNPTYEQVSSGGTGHAEAVQIVYDPSKVSYAKLLEVFWHNVDPLTPNRQFCDRGDQYRSAIFFHDAEQKRLAEKTRAEVEKELGKKVVTEIVPAAVYYPAEEYHQNYYEKNPVRYKFYRNGCGRDRRLEQLWGEKAGH